MKNFLAIAFIVVCFHAHAQSTITVSGEVTKQLKLTLQDIAKYPQVEVKGKDREGKEHTFKGTALATVLDSAGVTLGKNLRGENPCKVCGDHRSGQLPGGVFPCGDRSGVYSEYRVVMYTR